MNNFKQWFRNLRKEEPRFSPVDFYEEEKLFASPSSKEYLDEKIMTSYPKEISSLKCHLARALAERKTCTREDFMAQLQSLLQANSAMTHQRLLGVNENSEISKIVNDNFQEERAKLLFLAFGDLEISAEDAEKAVTEYLQKEQS